MPTSRDRCLKAVLHEEVDRIPLVLRIRPEPLSRLAKFLGLEGSPYVHEEVCRALGVDVRSTPGIRLKGSSEPDPSTPRDEEGGWLIGSVGRFELHRNLWGVETLWAPDHTYTYTYYRHPFTTIEELEAFEWPRVLYEDQAFVEAARKRYEDYWVGTGTLQAFETAWKLTGLGRFLLGMQKDDPLIIRILDNLFSLSTQQAILASEAGVDFITNGDDVGAQKSMLVSPRLWRRYLKPRYAAMFREVHKRGAFVLFHSDGWIEPIIPDLIEVGVDILNPIQPECMDPARLKELYGERLCFEGTIGVQSTLPLATPEKVAEEVRQRIRKCGPTGLILGPTHSIQPDVPIENILAMYEAARSYRLR
ncbi:MAG: uroporphyrinogen decarboxylase family protein [Candidatus Bathyarchaeia archaeon]